MSYEADWHPIKSEADLPKEGEYVLASWADLTVGENWREEGKWALGDGTPILAWAPMPESWKGE